MKILSAFIDEGMDRWHGDSKQGIIFNYSALPGIAIHLVAFKNVIVEVWMTHAVPGNLHE